MAWHASPPLPEYIVQSIVVSKLHLIDLAGSERLSKTDATGDRLKEVRGYGCVCIVCLRC